MWRSVGLGGSPASRIRLAAALGDRVGQRYGGQQRPGVGVPGVLEDLGDLAGLDRPAEVDDADPVGDVPDDRQVV